MFIRNERSLKEFIQLYPIVSTLIIIHIVLWFVMEFFQSGIGWIVYVFGVGNNLYVAMGEYWRLVSPIFLHREITHMLFNSFALVLFGPALELMLGKFKFILAYLAAGIIANIATFLIEPLNYTHLGASGSIYGLFGIYIFMVTFRKHLMDYGSSQMIKTILIIGILMSFVGARINIVAHLAGFAGGFAIAPLVLRNVRAFSPWRMYERNYPDNDGEIRFNPNRWRKRRVIPDSIRKNWLWIVIGILAVIGFFSRYIQ
ncbi:rhomboid family intramembrane serine protease [Oceanobacillus alkalisoli]|uniref:rhomboid family intramembrane serine protease n=1 Tax=Oceanobacillus alkalisoli TaxID=2925113 RepID=UPI001EF0DACE|nr:rhomboid family intramembrane serine protease [Oceanobacillus alkalisoli]MCF3944643.1 rhomboid family intramembrane serine protease [Oceanobacillus alkalisoli]MCG5104829.1 rhomboid family intramembrane serine protease [Oceanobacillus alkalisoli]